MASLILDVHPFKVNLTLFLDGNCFLIVSRVSVYSLWQMLLGELADCSPNFHCSALYDFDSLQFDIASPGISAQANPDIGCWFQVFGDIWEFESPLLPGSSE